MTSFQYDAKIIANYPQLVAGVIVAAGMKTARPRLNCWMSTWRSKPPSKLASAKRH